MVIKMNILQQIAQRTKERIESQKRILPPDAIVQQAQSSPVGNFPFENALKSHDISFICEVKKASPSKGVISEDFDHVKIAEGYQASGAAAISVLTEPYWFMGSDSYLQEISQAVSIPLLRKDFTVDSYMIYEAKVLGASAVLLICSLLNTDTIAEYIKIADSLGLSTLVETHDEKEVESALKASARIIGVNNRNLKTFDVDITLSRRLRKLVPPEVIFVSESGIKTRDDVTKMREIGANAVLIGETLMRGESLQCLM